MAIATQWFEGMSTEEKDSFEKTLRNSTRVLKQLAAIIERQEQSLQRQERSKAIYQTPDWAHLQAHLNGNLEMLAQIKQLITFYKKDT